jgi:hypothetical protein
VAAAGGRGSRVGRNSEGVEERVTDDGLRRLDLVGSLNGLYVWAHLLAFGSFFLYCREIVFGEERKKSRKIQ